MIIITCFGDKKRYFLYINCLGFSDEDNSASRTDNFMNFFDSVTSPRVLSHRCVLHYFLTMPVGIKTSSRWHQNCHCLQTIHFPR